MLCGRPIFAKAEIKPWTAEEDFYFAADPVMAGRLGLQDSGTMEVMLSVDMLPGRLPWWVNYFTIKHTPEQAIVAAMRGSSMEASDCIDRVTTWYVLQFQLSTEQMGRLLMEDMIERSWDYSGFQIKAPLRVRCQIRVVQHPRMDPDAWLGILGYKLGGSGSMSCKVCDCAGDGALTLIYRNDLCTKCLLEKVREQAVMTL